MDSQEKNDCTAHKSTCWKKKQKKSARLDKQKNCAIRIKRKFHLSLGLLFHQHTRTLLPKKMSVNPLPTPPVPRAVPDNQARWTSSAFDGVSVKNMYTNPLTRRVILYGSGEAAYDTNLQCKTGVANIDNVCECPGSSNSTPFNVEADMLSRLYVPQEQPSMIPPINHSLKCLMAERRPLHPSAPYEAYLGKCSNW